MKCSACNFWQRSQMHGNFCACTGVKPCDIERRGRAAEHKRKRDRRRQKWE